MARLYVFSAGALVAALLGGIGYLAATAPGAGDRFAACRATRIAGGVEAIGGPFTLVNGAGETVTDAEVIAEPAIVYFGYSFCPDICPFDAARNADAADLLAKNGVSATPVFVSIDPERDTPQVVGAFAAALHPKMVGLTGTPEQVRAASRAFRSYFRKQDGDPDHYLVDHSAVSYLALPGHGVVEVFRRDVTARQMAKAVACFASAAAAN